MNDADQIVTLFLQSIRFQPPGGKASFLSGNGKGRFGGIGLTLFIDLEKRKQAAILLAKSHPQFFAGKPISDITDLFSEFLTSDFSAEFDVVSAQMSQPPANNLSDTIPLAQYRQIWDLLENFIAGQRKTHLHIFPGHKIEPVADVICDELVLMRLETDMNAALKPRMNFQSLQNGFFPPVAQETRKYPLEKGGSWIGCFSEDGKFPESKIRSIAGAIFMAASPRQSRMFNMAPSQNGWISLSETNCKYGFDDAIIPRLYHPIILDVAEIDFLKSLLINKNGNERISNALRSIYEGWDTTGRERFVNFAIAFDALFGINRQVNKSICEGIERNAPAIPDIEKKAVALTKIRNDLAHGSKVSVESCPKYMEYFTDFGKDPVEEQFEILRTCLWSLASTP